MMKKITAVLLIALVVLSGAFAWGAKKGPDMMLGLETGWGMDIQFPAENVTVNVNNVPVALTFDVDFDEVPLRVGAAIGTDLFFYADENTTSDVHPTFAADLAVAYRYDLDKQLSFTAGLGFGYNLERWTEENTKSTYSVNTFGLFADLGGSYDVADNVVLNFGLKLGGNVAGSGALKLKVGDKTIDGNWDYDLPTNFAFGLNIGAAYKF